MSHPLMPCPNAACDKSRPPLTRTGIAPGRGHVVAYVECLCCGMRGPLVIVDVPEDVRISVRHWNDLPRRTGPCGAPLIADLRAEAEALMRRNGTGYLQALDTVAARHGHESWWALQRALDNYMRKENP